MLRTPTTHVRLEKNINMKKVGMVSSCQKKMVAINPCDSNHHHEWIEVGESLSQPCWWIWIYIHPSDPEPFKSKYPQIPPPSKLQGQVPRDQWRCWMHKDMNKDMNIIIIIIWWWWWWWCRKSHPKSVVLSTTWGDVSRFNFPHAGE